MSIAELLGVLSPPSSPLEVPSAKDWASAEARLGRLPDDYREFVEAYGTGTLDYFLWVHNPAASNENLNLMSQADANLAALAETSAEFPTLYPMARHPTPGGFLPFGGTDNGDVLYWETTGEPDEWTVAVMGPRAPEVFRFAGTMSEFLTKLIKREITCHRFPEDFLEEAAEFTAALG